MTEKERSTIIAQLAFSEGVTESVFGNNTDQELLDRLKYLFGEKGEQK